MPISSVAPLAPQKLYHLTSSRAWRAIQSYGSIKPNKDEFSSSRGVFAVDKTNFKQHWVEQEHWGRLLFNRQTEKVQQQDSALVLLEINPDDVQNRLFVRDLAPWNTMQLPTSLKEIVQYIRDKRRILQLRPISKPHDFSAQPVLEYFIKGSVPLKSIRKVGESDLSAYAPTLYPSGMQDEIDLTPSQISTILARLNF